MQVLKIYNEVCSNEKDTLDIKLDRKNGINSLSIVNLILRLEDIFEICLDDVLPEIRSARTLNDISDIVESLISDKK